MILNLFLLRNSRFFFAPDGDGGGGAAVLTAPVVDAPSGDPNADIMDFQAPDIGDISAAISGKKEEPATPPKPEKKEQPPAQKTVQKQDAPKGEPAALLRKELESAKAERDELRGRLEKGDPRLIEIQNQVKEREKELSDYKARIDDYEKKLLMANPAVTSKIRELDSNYDKESGKFFSRVPELDQSALNQLVREFHQLPAGRPEYREARAEFEAKVNERLGAGEGNEHRKLGTVLDFIERTSDFIQERQTTEREVTTNARRIARDAEVGDFSKRRDFVKTQIEQARQVPEDLIRSNPLHPKVALKNFVDGLGEAGKDLEKGIPEFIELAMAGLAPRADEDYAGMSPDQITESRQTETQNHEIARARAVHVLRDGAIALRLFPTLVREVQRLTEKVNERIDGTPPDPTHVGSDGTGNETDDVKGFRAPDLDSMNF